MHASHFTLSLNIMLYNRWWYLKFEIDSIENQIESHIEASRERTKSLKLQFLIY